MRKEYLYIILLVTCILGILLGRIFFMNVAYNNTVSQNNTDYLKIFNNEIALETSSGEEKRVSPNSLFALKKVYNECNHFEYEEAELPKELVNLSRQEIEDYYDDWEVEEFDDKKLVLCKEINGYCNQHFVIKLDDNQVKVYRLGTHGEYIEYKNTDIFKEYLPEEDIKKLEDGIMIYGEGKLSSVLEDYE